MTEQLPAASKEALELVSRLRRVRKQLPNDSAATHPTIIWFELNLLDAGKAIDALCEQRVSAERERCARRSAIMRLKTLGMRPLPSAPASTGEQPASPAAVVDYTERAQAVWYEIQASWPNKSAIAKIAATLSAVASERDAEIHEMQHDIDRYSAHAKAALLARLREPDVRGTAAKRVADYRQHGCHWALGTCTECQGIADAALTKIAEMLK